ncbi:MAG: nucleotidyltransferase domain-containing protein [Candidatus Kariarchaeaceae archaeon]|jgi:predicted nucleotidyltransferase
MTETDLKQSTKNRYNDVLDRFVAQVKQDNSIIAAILFGSLVNIDVWEKSDIDIVLVGKDEQTQSKDYWLMDEEITRSIQVLIYSRNRFKREVEKALQGSSMFHVLSTSKILFSKDESITEYVEEALNLGKRDREILILRIIPMVIGDLEKAEKFFYYKQDLPQSYLFITRLLDRLAQIVVLLNNKIPGREVIDQAMQYEPKLFESIFFDVILDKITEEKLVKILGLIRSYLVTNTPALFNPVLQYLSEAGEVRSNSDVVYHLNRLMPSDWWAIVIDGIGHWLTEHEYVYKVPCPIRLTKRSRMELDETGYYYIGGEEG